MNAALTDFLCRLDNVRETSGGGAYRADCPNGHRSRGSLAIREGDDGRVLLRCHSGCDVSDVVAAVGMTLSDLFPPELRRTRSGPRDRRQPNWKALCKSLSLEWSVIEVALGHYETHGDLRDEDWRRLHEALARIAAIRGRVYSHV